MLSVASASNLRTGVGKRRGLIAVTSAFAATSMALAVVITSPAQAATPGTTVQVSVPTGGFAPGSGGNGGSRHTERRLLSDDGRYVVFEASGAVVPGQTSLEWQIVKRDRHLGTTTLISKSSAGSKGNKRSSNPSMSADGRWVAFTSDATNLVPGDSNNQKDVFLHDSHTGKTTRVSVNGSGQQVGDPQKYGSSPASISANGRYISFLSYSAGLAAGDSVGDQAYLHDRVARTTELVSRGADDLPRSAMTTTSVSNDGNLVLFHSLDADVTPPESGNFDVDLFLRNRAAGTTTMVAGGQDGAAYGTISADGHFAAYQTEEGLDPADTGNSRNDVYVVNLATLQQTLISKTSSGVVGNKESRYPAISRDGRYITFQSTATNLVAGNTNSRDDIFRHDRTTGKTERVSLTTKGSPNPSDSRSPAISGDGKHILFDSHGKTLTPVSTRNWGQVFVRDMSSTWPALHARTGALPTRVHADKKRRIAAYDIRTGPALQITWQPQRGTKGTLIRRAVSVSGNAFILHSPKRLGSYTVTVSYGDNTLQTRTVNIVKPTAKKLPKAIKKGKKLKIKTVGLKAQQKISVQFKPRGGTRGKVVKRNAKVNKKGIAKVKTATRRGTYQVIIRAEGQVLRKAVIRIR